MTVLMLVLNAEMQLFGVVLVPRVVPVLSVYPFVLTVFTRIAEMWGVRVQLALIVIYEKVEFK